MIPTQPVDLDKIELMPKERRRLFAVRFRRRVKEAFFGEYLRHLYEIEFIRKNHTDEVDAFRAPIFDGTVSLTDTYFRYCIRRRRKFLEGSVWPCILSGVVSLIVSLITAYITARYIA